MSEELRFSGELYPDGSIHMFFTCPHCQKIHEALGVNINMGHEVYEHWFRAMVKCEDRSLSSVKTKTLHGS